MEKDIEHITREKVAIIRKKMMAAFCVTLGAAIVLIAAISCFYEIKLRALMTGLYNADTEAGERLIDMMFYRNYSLGDAAMYGSVMQKCGYTERGGNFIFFRSGQWFIMIAAAVIMAVIAIVCVRLIVKIGYDDIFSYVADISRENKKLMQKVKSDEKFLTERNEKLQNFTENIAHQIKTPLTALSLALDRLEERVEDKDILERCFEQIERIRTFIGKLMTISRMEAGKIIMTSQDVNMYELLNEVVSQIPEDNGCSIKIECNDEDYTVNADEEWLREAFINIIQNSSEICSQVCVSVVCYEEKCVVNIVDNGSGFDENEIPYVFDRFETTGDVAMGHAGIGLNLSKLIVEAHHGSVEAYNNEYVRGATIRVQIPKYTLKRKKEML